MCRKGEVTCVILDSVGLLVKQKCGQAKRPTSMLIFVTEAS